MFLRAQNGLLGMHQDRHFENLRCTAGGPFKPFFGLSGALLRRKPSLCRGD